MRFLWRCSLVGVFLFGGSAIAGCAYEARSLQESKMTLKEARAILVSSGQAIQLAGDGKYPLGKWPHGPAVAMTARVRQGGLTLQGRFLDGQGGTITITFPFTDTTLRAVRNMVGCVEEVYIHNPTATTLLFKSSEDAHRFIDALGAMREYAGRNVALSDTEANNFAQVVARYHSANPKPTLTEEVRKLQVQAEFAVDKKQIAQAIDRYEEALNIAPWWADGHFNRAFLLGEDENYAEAAAEMKKYLALEPTAKEVRAAQDMVYRWEGEPKPAKMTATCQATIQGRAS